jgi:hypothetical protein
MNSPDTQLASETGRDSVSVFRVAVYVAVLVALGAVLSVGAADAGAQADANEPVADAVTIDLDGTGDAVVTVTIPFDLTVEDEKTDFEAFTENESKQQAQIGQYESRLSNVAAEMESRTGRETTVTDASIATQTRADGDLGLVVLSVTWEGLAATDDSQIVLGPPFDNGFDVDRTVVVRPPEQHQVVSTTPTPEGEGGQLHWSGDQSLDEFEVVIEPVDEEDDGSGGDDGTDGGDGSGGDDGTGGDDGSGGDDGTDGDDGSSDDGTDGGDGSGGDDGTDGGDGSSDDGTDGASDDTTGDDEQAAASGDDASGPGFGIVAVLVGLAALAGVVTLGVRARKQ